jgi:peptidoglycan/LPS O-acetylase OafA/YrhL
MGYISFHPLCFDWVLHSPLGQYGIVSLVAAFTVVLGVALASYKFYESPFLKLKKYFV